MPGRVTFPPSGIVIEFVDEGPNMLISAEGSDIDADTAKLVSTVPGYTIVDDPSEGGQTEAADENKQEAPVAEGTQTEKGGNVQVQSVLTPTTDPKKAKDGK